MEKIKQTNSNQSSIPYSDIQYCSSHCSIMSENIQIYESYTKLVFNDISIPDKPLTQRSMSKKKLLLKPKLNIDNIVKKGKSASIDLNKVVNSAESGSINYLDQASELVESEMISKDQVSDCNNNSKKLSDNLDQVSESVESEKMSKYQLSDNHSSFELL